MRNKPAKKSTELRFLCGRVFLGPLFTCLRCLELSNVDFLRPNVQLVFTEILSVVVLLAFPTVVIVTVGPAYCCYCSSPRTVVSVPLRHPAPRATLPQILLRSGDSVKNGPTEWELGKNQKIGDKDRLEPRTPRKKLIILTTTLSCSSIARLKKDFIGSVLLAMPKCWPSVVDQAER